MIDMARKGKFMRVYMFEGPEDKAMEKEWNNYYNKEHAPIVVKHAPNVIRAYRYVAMERDGKAPKYLTIYEMSTPDAMSDEKSVKERHKALDTEWFRRIGETWKQSRNIGYGDYKQIYPEEGNIIH